MGKKLSYVWDYEIDSELFDEILHGKRTIGRLNQEWAALRLLEYASYYEIIDKLGYCWLIHHWRFYRDRIRSVNRRRGFDFLVEWLPEKHPELCHE